MDLGAIGKEHCLYFYCGKHSLRIMPLEMAEGDLVREEVTSVIISIELAAVSSWARQAHHMPFPSCPLVEGSAEQPRAGKSLCWLCMVHLWFKPGRIKLGSTNPEQMPQPRGWRAFRGWARAVDTPLAQQLSLCGHQVSDKWVSALAVFMVRTSKTDKDHVCNTLM